jgi:hypothetical protein
MSRWDVAVTQMGKQKMHVGFLWRDHLERGDSKDVREEAEINTRIKVHLRLGAYKDGS